MSLHVLLAESATADAHLVLEALRFHEIDCELTVLRSAVDLKQYWDTISIQPSERCPAVFLLDIGVPGADAVDVLKKFRRRCPLIPVILLVPFTSHPEINNLQEVGVDAIFEKTADLEQVLTLGGIIKDLLKPTTRFDDLPKF